MRLAFLIYDNDSALNDFPLGIGYLISCLRRTGFPDEDIHLCNMDVYHYSDEYLLDYLKRGAFDVIGIGMLAGYWQFKQLLRMFRVIEKLPKRPIVVLGGFMFTPDPAYFMRKTGADYVMLGESEQYFPEFINRLAHHRSVTDVPGIAYWDGDRVRLNPRPAPLKDLDSLPFPAWERFPIENYVTKVRIPGVRAPRCMPVLSSRGCMYQCTFCYRMEDGGLRLRSLDNVMEELGRLITDYNINSISFRDELFMYTPQRAIEFSERIMKEGFRIKFEIDGRLAAAKPEALRVLKEAGCVYINYGVESLDQDVLNNMHKKQTIAHIMSGVKETIAAGINPGLNVIFGNIGDNRETCKKTVDFLLEYNTYGEMRTLKPVTPYPGSPLFDTAVQRGLIKDVADFYEHKHLNSDQVACNFTTLSDKELYDVLFEANSILIRDHYNHLTEAAIEAHKRLYFEGDTSFRGVRH